ncbi:hypothetical protein KUC3_02240 [Alteromonas sp. KC3]|nr:hypothetical protein KUC3_02240 [Alteromonas sp. KC3]BCO21357.1 hypothetical protein KUC14_02260 [Alteromonas sp. KC14]
MVLSFERRTNEESDDIKTSMLIKHKIGNADQSRKKKCLSNISKSGRAIIAKQGKRLTIKFSKEIG